MRAAFISTLFLTFKLSLAPVMVSAEEMKFGDIEVGKTLCSDAKQLLETAGAYAGPVDENSEARNLLDVPAYKLRPNSMGFDFVQEGVVFCDATGHRVDAILLLIDEDGGNTIADMLAHKHKTKLRNLPRAQNGRAFFVSESGNSSAVIVHDHLTSVTIVNMT
jgi:hypothetical protein